MGRDYDVFAYGRLVLLTEKDRLTGIICYG